MIGVVGGGQLAKLLVAAGKERAVDVIVQTTSKFDPAAFEASQVVLSDPTNVEGTKLLAKKCMSITFENEWVDISSLMTLQNEGVSFFPKIESIKPLINKISQRELLNRLDIPCPVWMPLSRIKSSNINLPKEWTFPVMAKAASGGYDGKGTRIIENLKQLDELIALNNGEKWFIERWVSYEKELSIVASRDSKGSVRCFPIAETYQSNQVCDWVIAPAHINQDVLLMANNIASSLLSELDYVGVLAIEFFYGKDGLLVNEIAPRTHNSGHFSIEACTSSQFDQQICISSGKPVPIPEMIVPGALMVNLLGLPSDFPFSINSRLDQLKNIPGMNVHWYGKKEEKAGRKLGHVTYLLSKNDAISRKDEATEVLKKIRSIWPTCK